MRSLDMDARPGRGPDKRLKVRTRQVDRRMQCERKNLQTPNFTAADAREILICNATATKRPMALKGVGVVLRLAGRRRASRLAQRESQPQPQP